MILDRLLTRAALLSIRGYQRYLSPVKGFSCALRVATGGDSCSAFGYRVIDRRGIKQGLGLLKRRMEACGHVHRQNIGRAHGPLHAQRGECDLPCDSCDLLSCGCDWWNSTKKNNKNRA